MRRGGQLSVVVAAGLGVAKTVQAPARPEFTGDKALVLRRIGDVEVVVPLYLGDSFVARLEKTSWSRSFLIAVMIRRETTGYVVRGGNYPTRAGFCRP